VEYRLCNEAAHGRICLMAIEAPVGLSETVQLPLLGLTIVGNKSPLRLQPLLGGIGLIVWHRLSRTLDPVFERRLT